MLDGGSNRCVVKIINDVSAWKREVNALLLLQGKHHTIRILDHYRVKRTGLCIIELELLGLPINHLQFSTMGQLLAAVCQLFEASIQRNVEFKLINYDIRLWNTVTPPVSCTWTSSHSTF